MRNARRAGTNDATTLTTTPSSRPNTTAALVAWTSIRNPANRAVNSDSACESG